MIWKVLGIDQTKDKKAITRAYRERLSSVNPEEKPEEFKELRAAYEEAMKKADEAEIPREEKSELDLWKDELADIYNNFQARIDVDAWKELLSRDICQGLDTRPQVEEALLTFLMDHFQMTQKVMRYLEEEFAFSDHIEELMEKYPRDFIEFFLIDCVRYGENLPLDMFTPGFDAAACDAYAALYLQARRVAIDEAGEIYSKMQASPEIHPYGEALILKAALYQGDHSVLSRMAELQEEWPEDEHLAVDLAIAYKLTGDMEQMRAVCEKILERNPEHFNARQYLAEADAAAGDYKSAIEKLNRLIQDAQGDQNVVYELGEIRKKWNETYAENLEQKLAENPEDHETRWELCWSYIEKNNPEPAYALAEELPEGQPDAFSYYNLMAVLAECKNANEEALSNLEKLLEVIRKMQPDGTEKTANRLDRTAEIMGRIAGNLMELRRFDESEKMMDLALAEKPEDLNNLLHMTQLALCIKKYKKAEELADLYIRQGSRNAFGYYLKASACFRMGNDSQAFQMVNIALDLDGSNLQFYLLKLRILMRNHAFEPADALLTFLEDNGIKDDPTMSFCKIQRYLFTRQGKNKEELEKYLQLAQTIDEQIASGNYGKPFWGPEFYYDYTDLTFDYQKMQEKVVAEELIAILDKGIALEPDDYNCRSYKAWILKREKKYPESLEIYKELEKDPEHGLNVEAELAEIYYSKLENNAEKALHYYEILLKASEETSDRHFYAGMCCLRLDQLEEARQHFLKEQEMDPEDIDGYYRLAYTYLKMNRLEDALEQAEKTVELAKKRKEEDKARFFQPLIKTLRRMNKPDEAIQAVEECAAWSKGWLPEQDIYEILIQFGRYAEAGAHLKLWLKNRKKDDYLIHSLQAELLMLQRKNKTLFAHLLNYRQIMEADQLQRSEFTLSILNGKYGKCLPLAEKAFREMQEKGRENSSTRNRYVRALWYTGAREEAKEEALKAIKILDGEIQKAKADKLISQTKRAYLLAIAGRIEEARAEMEHLENAPMCEQCVYCRCKDLEVFRCEVELIAGEYEKALQMTDAALADWKDEEDLLQTKYYAENMLKKS